MPQRATLRQANSADLGIPLMPKRQELTRDIISYMKREDPNKGYSYVITRANTRKKDHPFYIYLPSDRQMD